MTLQKNLLLVIIGTVLLPYTFVSAVSALTVTCSGVPTASSIEWTSSVQDGVLPLSYAWSNGATSSSQTVTAAPGEHNITLEVTDASSTVATASCSATVLEAPPTILSFTASPSAIIAGQSVVLSWNVSSANSLTIDHGIGAVTGTSATVNPATTTTYALTATNAGGSTSASATVAVSTPTSPLSAQILAILEQISALKAQIAALLAGTQTNQDDGDDSATVPLPFCFDFWRNLKHGDVGDDVKALQQQLAHDDPTSFPPGLITGFFGPKTFAAVKMWQRRYGVDPLGTGFFGQLSRDQYKARCQDKDSDDDVEDSDDLDDDNDSISDLEDDDQNKGHGKKDDTSESSQTSGSSSDETTSGGDANRNDSKSQSKKKTNN